MKLGVFMLWTEFQDSRLGASMEHLAPLPPRADTPAGPVTARPVADRAESKKPRKAKRRRLADEITAS